MGFSSKSMLLGATAIAAGLAVQPGTPAQADIPERVPQTSALHYGQIRLWLEGDRVMMDEKGVIQQLPLGNTAEANRLRDMLRNWGASQNVGERMNLVGGGGSGARLPQSKKDRDTPPSDASQGAENNVSGVTLSHQMILVGGGGEGFHLPEGQKRDRQAPAPDTSQGAQNDVPGVTLSHQMILVGGGGDGFHLPEGQKQDRQAKKDTNGV